MSIHHQSVQDYIRACKALLKLGELSDKEAEAVEEMFGRIADKFLTTASRQGVSPLLSNTMRQTASGL